MNKVKTLDDLRKMRESLRASLDLREKSNNPEQMVQIKVAMATCGIASGARPVLNTLVKEVEDRNLEHVIVTQTGCIGLCQYEPIVEVMEPGKPKITYIKMNADKAAEVVERHLIGGHIVEEYTLNSADLK